MSADRDVADARPSRLSTQSDRPDLRRYALLDACVAKLCRRCLTGPAVADADADGAVRPHPSLYVQRVDVIPAAPSSGDRRAFIAAPVDRVFDVAGVDVHKPAFLGGAFGLD